MSPNELFNALSEGDVSFTKPSYPSERQWHIAQQMSMRALIALGLAEEKSKNKYTLTQEGIYASQLGLEKWVKSLKDKNKKQLAYYHFNFPDKWYDLPRLKKAIEYVFNSKISKELWIIIRGVLIFIIGSVVLALFEII